MNVRKKPDDVEIRWKNRKFASNEKNCKTIY